MKTKQKYSVGEFQNFPATKAVRAGFSPGENLEHCEPIFQTSGFHFENCAHAAGVYSREIPGFRYSRWSNPTVQIFEKRVAALENAKSAIATASGAAAISQLFFALLKSGDRVVSDLKIYGGTHRFLTEVLKKFGIETIFIDGRNSKNWEIAAEKFHPKIFFFETPTNPTLNLVDLEKVAAIARAKKIKTIVDGTLSTPIGSQPLKFGIDFVVHSATKFFDGHGRAVGGIICGNDAEFLENLRATFLGAIGGNLNAFDAWLFLKSLETLPLRFEKHCENATKIAEFLEKNSKVKKVNFPFAKNFPQLKLAKKQMKLPGALLSFELENFAAAKNFIENLKLISHVGNLGDAKSTAGHPASTSHSSLSEKDLIAAEISPSLVRFSAGLEDARDLIADFANSLEKI